MVMDKKLKRQILYKPGNQVVEPKKKKENPKTVPPPKIEPKPSELPDTDQSAKISTWIGEHPHFKVAPMCMDLKIDPANFNKYLKMKSIPEKYIQPIIKVLKEYGYAG